MHRGDPDQPGANGEALTHAFLELRNRLVGTAYHIVGDREDAREAVQEAFLKCWRKRWAIRGYSSLPAWIFAVVLNTARDTRRRRRVRRSDTLPGEGSMPPSTKEPGPPVAAERQELVERVREAIPALPEREREVFLLRQNGDLTYSAIAEILGAPVGTVKTRMRSALIRLRTVLAPAPRPGPQLRTEPGR